MSRANAVPIERMAETPILTSVLSFVRFVNFVVSRGEDLGTCRAGLRRGAERVHSKA